MSDMYPPVPDDKVLDALEAFQDELKCWRATPEESSRYNDNGTLKYKRMWLERMEPLPERFDEPVAVETTIERYLVDTDQHMYIVKAKAMEKALESYKP